MRQWDVAIVVWGLLKVVVAIPVAVRAQVRL